MKKILFIILAILCHLDSFAQLGYWCNSKFIPLTPDESCDYRYIQAMDTESQEILCHQFATMEMMVSKPIRKLGEKRFYVNNDLRLPVANYYESTVYKSPEGERIVIYPRIVVSLKDGYHIDRILEHFGSKMTVESSERSRFVLSCHMKTSKEVLEAVQIISKLDGIKYFVPEMSINVKRCNSLYPYQYYLHNTSGAVNINVVPAWSITNGSSAITIAVIDDGVEKNHEDLSGNVLNGYTINNPTGYGEPQNEDQYDQKAHGTACAGIIAAKNNQIGIRGIASGSKILPVNIYYRYYEEEDDDDFTNLLIAHAIRWAYPKADILNFSLTFSHDDDEIISAINDALTYGRNGKGCIIVASSGNLGDLPSNVARPARYGGVIAVGAVLNDGVVWGLSQQGDSLDLVAPGGNFIGQGNIVTTDRMAPYGYVNYSNYTNTFGATSSSCAEVSGIVALMLSVNPNLTSGQIRNVLRSTATDLGPTGFDTAYGYGLVNATKAVLSVMSLNIVGASVINNSESYYVNNLPSGFTVTWSLSDSYYNSNCIQQDTPSANRCTITRNSSHNMTNATLTASIKYSGTTVYTITKTVSTPEVFSGTYYNGQMTKQINLPSPLYVLGGTDANVTSPNLIGASVSYGGNATPYIWSLNSTSGILHVGMPSSGGNAIVVSVTTALGNSFTLPIIRASTVSSISVGTGLGLVTVSLVRDEVDSDVSSLFDDGIDILNSTQQVSWKLEAYNATTGQKAFNRDVDTESVTIDTTGWVPGVYLIKATIGVDTLTEKVVVK